MVPDRLCNGVSELPTGVPTGVRAAGGAKGDRVPTADVGAPSSRAGVAGGAAAGAAAATAVPWSTDLSGRPAAITAPTLPAIPPSASRRVMSVSGPALAGSCSSEPFREDTELPPVGMALSSTQQTALGKALILHGAKAYRKPENLKVESVLPSAIGAGT